MNSPQTPYQILGEDGIRDLTSAFYDIMDELPEAKGLRAMHARDLAPMKEKLAEYLIGWMGGPPLYADKYGTVCMTTPHEPYHIGPEERDQWLLCMDLALERIESWLAGDLLSGSVAAELLVKILSTLRPVEP